MPADWWLAGTNPSVWSPTNGIRCLFAVQVHRKNKEIAVDCTAAPPGQSRNEQRAASATDTATARAEARAASRIAERDLDPYYHREKKLRLMVVNVAILEKQSNMISKHLAMLTQGKESFLQEHSQAEYDSKVNKLLKALPDPVQALMLGDEDDDEVTV